MSDHITCELAPYATRAAETRGRLIPEAPSASRTPFQRDRDRILHSGAFRKMRNKTQVFIESEGDYYRTRLTHTLEVAQIARSISRALGLDEDLTETIALAHDLGHTCFGHAGEEGLDESLKPYGGFNHNEQTFHIITKLENRYARFDGLNLSWETLEGIAKHNGPLDRKTLGSALRDFDKQWDLELSTFAGPEAQVAALSDDIAYNTHDIDDGYRAGFFQMEDLSELPLFNAALKKMTRLYPDAMRARVMYEIVREVIGLMIDDVLATTRQNMRRLKPRSAKDIRHAAGPTVSFSEEMTRHVAIIHLFLHSRMYRHGSVNEACAKARRIVRELFAFYMRHPDSMPSSWSEAFKTECDEAAKARIVADYIAGMTDRYAIKEHRKWFDTEIVI